MITPQDKKEKNGRVMPDFCNRRYPFHYVTALNLLARSGIDPHNVDLLAVGEYENYKGEILEQDPVAGEPLRDNTKIKLKVGFSSPVDYMPYQFFFGLEARRATGGHWEENSRFLLAPFDAAVMRHNALARFLSLKYDMGIIEVEHLKKILKLFDITLPPHSNSLDEILFWLSMLPTFHFWAGNPDLTARAFSLIFGYDFQILENTRTYHKIPAPLRYQLGIPTGRLGCETILGYSFSELDSGYDIVIGGVRESQVQDLLPGGRTHEKLKWLIDFCMPNNLVANIKIRVNREKDIQNKYLGYSSFI